MPTFDASAIADDLLPVDTLRVLTGLVTEWFLIGAFARDVVVCGQAGLPRASETDDIDLAIAVSDEDEYRRRVSGLDEAGGLKIRHRVGQVPVDVIAYGAIAPDNVIEDDGVLLDVTGLDEAAKCAMDVRLAPDLAIRCASLHAQVALKLVAWTARGRSTNKDAADLASLLEASYSGSFGDQVWGDNEALEANDHCPDLAGPYRVGRALRRGFDPNTQAHIRRSVTDDSLDLLVSAMSRNRIELRHVRDRVLAFRAGLAIP